MLQADMVLTGNYTLKVRLDDGNDTLRSTWQAVSSDGDDVVLKVFSTITHDTREPFTEHDLNAQIEAFLPHIDMLVARSGSAGLGRWIEYQFDRDQHQFFLVRPHHPQTLLDRYTPAKPANLKPLFSNLATTFDTIMRDLPDFIFFVMPQDIMFNDETITIVDYGMESLNWAIESSFKGPRTITPRMMYASTWYSPWFRFQQPIPAQFALGSLYHYLQTGQTLFEVDDTQARKAYADEGRLPEGLHPAVRRAMAKDPQDRFESCMAFVHALE